MKPGLAVAVEAFQPLFEGAGSYKGQSSALESGAVHDQESRPLAPPLDNENRGAQAPHNIQEIASGSTKPQRHEIAPSRSALRES